MKLILIFFALIFIAPINSWAQTEEQIRSTLLLNLEATQNEDLNGIMDTFHSESPIYKAQEKWQKEWFRKYDINYDLISFNLIAEEPDFAYARFKVSMIRLSGKPLQDQEFEAISVFKKENGNWKLWNQVNLQHRYL